MIYLPFQTSKNGLFGGGGKEKIYIYIIFLYSPPPFFFYILLLLLLIARYKLLVYLTAQSFKEEEQRIKSGIKYLIYMGGKKYEEGGWGGWGGGGKEGGEAK